MLKLLQKFVLVTAQLHQISAMPTFIVLLNRAELGRVRGADANSLEQLIASNITSANKEVKNNPNAATEEERKWLAQFVTYSEKVFVFLFQNVKRD